jgi:hypothetical protein
MTAFDRIEQRMPELMAELAPATLPDYFDDMLGQTGRTRQRPAWASLERWLPMDVVARPSSFRAPALRPLLIVVIIGLLAAAALALYAGSQRTRLPDPFGPARNGLVVVATGDGDIAAVDPVTGSTSTLIGGPTNDVGPWFARDGQHFMFVRQSGTGAYWIADADGSNARELVPGPVDWFEWSDAGDRIVVTQLLSGGPATSIVEVEDGRKTLMDVGMEISRPFWRPGHDQIVFLTETEGAGPSYYLVDADGTGLRYIAGVSPDAINDPVISGDGSQLAYSTWADGAGQQGRIHVVDIESGVDEALMFDGSDGTNEFPYAFSPDGSKLLLERHGTDPSYEVNGVLGYRLVVVPVDGAGPVVPIGPPFPSGTGGAHAAFSPDGTQVLSNYNADHSTWLLEADGSDGDQVDWASDGDFTWQRLAP